MKTIVIREELVQAQSLKQLAGRSGKRIERLPFYCESRNGHDLIFHILTGETNAAWLRDMINAGRIYLRKSTVLERASSAHCPVGEHARADRMNNA